MGMNSSSEHQARRARVAGGEERDTGGPATCAESPHCRQDMHATRAKKGGQPNKIISRWPPVEATPPEPTTRFFPMRVVHSAPTFFYPL